MTLLAIRHVGGYAEMPEPLSPNDKLWTRILAWAEEHKLKYQPIAARWSFDGGGFDQ